MLRREAVWSAGDEPGEVSHAAGRKEPPQGRIHRAPVQTCTCGLYAGRDVAKLLRVLGPPVAPMVLCGIEAGGRIVVHQWGFRSEEAKIVAISAELPSRVLRGPSGQVIQVRARRGIEPWAAEELARRYGAMLIDLHGMASALQQFGDFIEEE